MRRVILHVDDEENDLLLTKFAFEKAGIVDSIQIASDGQQAIDYLAGNGEFAYREEFPLPYLILLDLKLPQVPGLEVLKWIRHEAGLKVPVVILTSSQSDADVAAAYELGANAYLVKPPNTSKLAEMAKAVKDFWLNENTPAPGPSPVTGRPQALQQRSLLRQKGDRGKSRRD
jgi:CheY-like chemotaxis protein